MVDVPSGEGVGREGIEVRRREGVEGREGKRNKIYIWILHIQDPPLLPQDKLQSLCCPRD